MTGTRANSFHPWRETWAVSSRPCLKLMPGHYPTATLRSSAAVSGAARNAKASAAT